MLASSGFALTERQRRELEYHREHAAAHSSLLRRPFDWEVLDNPGQRWWNAYWQMFAVLKQLHLQGRKVLVVGCGFGDDALRLARLGAEVYAFDLSPDSLAIASRLAQRERLRIHFEQMPAESLTYADNSFDCVLARDILHHVDIPLAMREIVRVSKPAASLVVNEIYSHSLTDRIRRSSFVEQQLYPRMQRFVYGKANPYITEDERKLSEKDVAQVKRAFSAIDVEKHFNCLVTRLVPDSYTGLAQADRLFLRAVGPLASYLCGRILFAGRIGKAQPTPG